MHADSQGSQSCLWAGSSHDSCHWHALPCKPAASPYSCASACRQPKSCYQLPLISTHLWLAPAVTQVHGNSQGPWMCLCPCSHCRPPLPPPTTALIKNYTVVEVLDHNCLNQKDTTTPRPGASTCPHTWCTIPIDLGSEHAPVCLNPQLKVFSY